MPMIAGLEKKILIDCVICYYPVLCYKEEDENKHVGKEKKMGNKRNVHAIKSWDFVCKVMIK